MNKVSLTKKFESRPVSHSALKSFLNHLRNPNDKIHRLISDGKLIALKKGLYIFNPDLVDESPSLILLANHIYGPSYVTNDFALQFYNAIPEQVNAITSVTTKVSKVFENSMGYFIYSHVPKDYYSVGISQVALSGNVFAMMASPEKAIVDKVVTTKGVLFRSVADAESYFRDDLRIEESWLKELNVETLKSIRMVAAKSNSLSFMIEFIKQL